MLVFTGGIIQDPPLYRVVRLRRVTGQYGGRCAAGPGRGYVWALQRIENKRQNEDANTIIIIDSNHALGHKGTEIGTFLPKTGLEPGAFKDTTLNY